MTLLDEMMDNIERIGKGNLSTGGDVTEMESYDPSQRVGPVDEHSRDFYAGQGTTTEIPAGMRDVIIPGHTLPMPVHHSPDTWTVNGVHGEVNVDVPASALTTSQAMLYGGAGAIQILQTRPRRGSVVVSNTAAAGGATIYIGSNSGVTVNTGFPIIAGTSLTVPASCGLWAVSSADVIVACLEYLFA